VNIESRKNRAIAFAVLVLLVASAQAGVPQIKQPPGKKKSSPKDTAPKPSPTPDPAPPTPPPTPKPAPVRDAQFVDSDDYCVAGDHPLEPGSVSCTMTKMKAAPDKNGVAQFEGRRPSQYFAQSHIAKPDELAVAKMVLVPSTGSISGAPPKNREDATRTSWTIKRIASLDDKAGVLLVGLGNPVARDVLRVVDGDTVPAVKLTSKEDRHWFHSEHWLVSPDALDDPTEGMMYPAIALVPPAKPGDAGEFLLLYTGERVKTVYAVRSRAATPAELKPGVRVALIEGLGDISSRQRALGSRWMMTKVVSATSRSVSIGDYSGTHDRFRIILP